ncbi:unnamed protein product [Mytilus edulis]|uniref:Uncharacterized protein n=1 Tax=Mytilus edulis TaxID=6550 RepID=A0A8S3SYG7_MYTED|nr:unnamed protein product [Mytilus edulis]
MASKEDTNTNSKTGCTVLHYAALNGLVDVITTIGEQEKNKSKVFDAKNLNNKSPFSLAVDGKNIDICIFLCDVGAEVDITEWGLALMNINMLREDKITILELITELMVGQTYGKDEDIQFVTIATILPEIFKVPKSGTTIEPKMEPGCCIQIPEGTFESEKLLSVNIAETYDWKTEISGKSDVLFTNVLKVVIAGGAQPKKPVIMTLPLHSKTIKESEIVIISSSKAMPKENEDWEVVKTANTKIVDAKIVFEVSHFSWAGAANKQSLFESIVQATKAMVFSDDLIVDDVMFSENRMPMYFEKNKDRSKKMFHLLSSEKTPKGHIYIERQVTPIQENDFEPKIETVESNWIKNRKKPRKIEYENCLTLPIGMQDSGSLVEVGGKRNTATRQTKAAVDEDDDNGVRATPKVSPAIGGGTIYVLRKRSLRRIGERLTDEECYELGKLLRLEKQTLDQLKKGKGTIQDKVSKNGE